MSRMPLLADVEAADSAFEFLDDYSVGRECPSLRSSASYNAGMVYMLSADSPEPRRTVDAETSVIEEHGRVRMGCREGRWWPDHPTFKKYSNQDRGSIPSPPPL